MVGREFRHYGYKSNKTPLLFEINVLNRGEDAFEAIKNMIVRGAPLIGITAAYGVYLFARQLSDSPNFVNDLRNAALNLINARPTAVNLKWAVEKQLKLIENAESKTSLIQILLDSANKMAEEDIITNKSIGKFGLELLQKIYDKKGFVNILTHCNAGWLATVDYGTATAPIYLAHQSGIKLHVWVDETRPRNQGSKLTAFELLNEGVLHSVIPDNTGGHLMQNGLVDLVIVGCDRVAANGDVCNKIGTYLKALAAYDNEIPFYVAMPTSTLDKSLRSGKEIPIEERDASEVRYFTGLSDNKETDVLTLPEKSNAVNYGFDVTPAKYVTGLITEKGIVKPIETDLLELES